MAWRPPWRGCCKIRYFANDLFPPLEGSLREILPKPILNQWLPFFAKRAEPNSLTRKVMLLEYPVGH